ncbi:unnamed protein product, partial [Prunus brigantina]
IPSHFASFKGQNTDGVGNVAASCAADRYQCLSYWRACDWVARGTGEDSWARTRGGSLEVGNGSCVRRTGLNRCDPHGTATCAQLILSIPKDAVDKFHKWAPNSS